MNAFEVGKKLVELCKQGKSKEAMETLYSPDIVSVEPGALPDGQRETRGYAGLQAKAKWWYENHEIHSLQVEGPWPHDDRFVVRFTYDITNKPLGRRLQLDEVGLFTVEGGKVVREEFFYSLGG